MQERADRSVRFPYVILTVLIVTSAVVTATVHRALASGAIVTIPG